LRRDADRAEEPACDGAEECLRELVVRQAFDLAGERVADPGPQRPVERALTELETELCDCPVDVPVVELDAFDGVPLAALPVPLIEAARRAASDSAELRVVEREGRDDVVGGSGWVRITRCRLFGADGHAPHGTGGRRGNDGNGGTLPPIRWRPRSHLRFPQLIAGIAKRCRQANAAGTMAARWPRSALRSGAGL